MASSYVTFPTVTPSVSGNIRGFVHPVFTRLHEATIQYIQVAKKHDLTQVELALGFLRDRPFVTSTIIGATSVEQLKEDIDAFLMKEGPFSPEVMADIEAVFRRYKDPFFLMRKGFFSL